MTAVLQSSLQRIDRWLDGITMYRLVVYYLIALLIIAVPLAVDGKLPFSVTALLVTSAVTIGVCVLANPLLARLVGATPNPESALITGLILSLIVAPGTTAAAIGGAAFIATAAMASKYLLIWRRTHLFNPAALGAVAGGVLIGQYPSWWIGTTILAVPVIIGGLLLARRTRRLRLVLIFLATVVIGLLIVDPHTQPIHQFKNLIGSSVLFLAFVMLTEPLTAPPARWLPTYGLFAGVLFISPQFGYSSFSLTPEMALVVTNGIGYLLAPRARYQMVLQRTEQVARNTVALHFAKPPHFSFQPGQYLEWSLPHQPRDRRGQRRYFSLASSPAEPEVIIGVKFYDHLTTYKQALRQLQPGAALEAHSLEGEFVLPKNSQPVVLIAGGIGITPFRSMVRDLIDRGKRRTIRVVYAASSPEDFAFLDVFEQAEARGVATELVARSAPPGWPGTTGLVDRQVLARAAAGVEDPLYYISGSVGFVGHCHELLSDLQVPTQNIKTDYFPGLGGTEQAPVAQQVPAQTAG